MSYQSTQSDLPSDILIQIHIKITGFEAEWVAPWFPSAHVTKQTSKIKLLPCMCS